MASRTTRSQHLVCLLVVAAAVTWLYSALLQPIAFTSHEGIYIYARTQQVAAEHEEVVRRRCGRARGLHLERDRDAVLRQRA